MRPFPIALVLLALAACVPEGPSGARSHVTDATAPPPSSLDEPGTATTSGSGTELAPVQILSYHALDLEGGHPLMKGFDLTLSRAATVRLECTSPDDSREDFTLSAESSAAPHLDLYGLLADTAYQCEAVATDSEGNTDSNVVSFETGSLPDELPDVSLLDDAGVDQGYVLFNHRNGVERYVLVDRDARIRWYKLLDSVEQEADIGIELAWHPELGQVLACGGNGITPQLFALDGTEAWRAPEPVDPAYAFHHDCARLDDGTVLALKATTVTYQDADYLDGTEINQYDASGSILWQWTTQMGVDQGRLEAANYGPDDADPWHANAVAWVDDSEGPAVFLSNFGQSDILRIDRTTEQITWILSPTNGDFALQDEHGDPLDATGWFSGEHGLDYAVEADGLHILLYDNGTQALASRVMELQVDPSIRLATRLWVFEEPDWYTPIYGDADWLPDGRVLVAKGNCWTCANVPAEQRSEVLIFDPVTMRVSWRIQLGDKKDGLYRAQRIDPCEIFGNQRFCPAVSQAAP